MMTDYDFQLKDFGDQGSQIILCKRNRNLSCKLCILAVVTSAVCMYEMKYTKQLLLFPISLISGLVFITYTLQKVHYECLTIISSLGVNIKQSSWLSSKVQYFDIQHVKDIVIIEAISMYSIICQLVLLQQQSSNNSSNNGKPCPLFTTFHPRLDHLKIIYNQVQKKLIIPRGKPEDR